MVGKLDNHDSGIFTCCPRRNGGGYFIRKDLSAVFGAVFIRLKEGIKIVRRNTPERFCGVRTLNSVDGTYYLTQDYFNFLKCCDGLTQADTLLPLLIKATKSTLSVSELTTKRRVERMIAKTDLVNCLEVADEPKEINRQQIKDLVEKQVLPCTYAIWELTRACNARCKHCYQIINGNRDLEVVAPYTKDEISRILENLNALGVQDVKFTGGEITVLGHELLNYIFIECFRLAMPFRINSNGLLPLKFLLEVAEKNPFFRGLQISLDGYGDVHDEFRGVEGMFAEVRKNIEAIRPAVRLQVVTMLHPELYQTQRRIGALVKYVLKTADSWLIESPATIGNWKIHNEGDIESDIYVYLIKEIIKQNPNFNFTIPRIFDYSFLEEFPNNEPLCGSHQDMINISPGGISFCVPFKASFPSLTHLCKPHDSFKEVLKVWNKIGTLRIKGNPLCSNCEYKQLCRGGCPGQYVDAKKLSGCDRAFKNTAKKVHNVYDSLKKDKDFQERIKSSTHRDYFTRMFEMY